jgi:hypothetical protein
MSDGKRRIWAAMLFWAGGCASFALPPLLSAYVFNDFVPQPKGRTPIENAVIRAQLGGILMLIPTAIFQYAQSRCDRNAFLERRPGAAALALLLGLATPIVAYLLPESDLLSLVVYAAAPLASVRLMFKAPK